MADLNMVLSEAQKLNRSIRSLLRLSTYEDYDDLSGLHIDYEDEQQLFLQSELREILEKLSDVTGRITYTKAHSIRSSWNFQKEKITESVFKYGVYGKICMTLVNGSFRMGADSITDNKAGLSGGRKKFNRKLIEI